MAITCDKCGSDCAEPGVSGFLLSYGFYKITISFELVFREQDAPDREDLCETCALAMVKATVDQST